MPFLKKVLRSSALAACLFGSSGAFALSSMPTTGTCAMLGNFVYSFAYQYGNNTGGGWGLNILATLDFDTGTMRGSMVAMNPNGAASTQGNVLFSGPMTVTTLTNGFYRIESPVTVSASGLPAAVAAGETFNLSFNAIPVNNSSTLLVQMRARPLGEADGTWTGVCQF